MTPRLLLIYWLSSIKTRGHHAACDLKRNSNIILWQIELPIQIRFLPILSPSAITTILDDYLMLYFFCSDSRRRSNPKSSSGINFFLPCTNTIQAYAHISHYFYKNNRLWELAVSLILSITSTCIQSRIVPKGVTRSKMSLSIVPGIPITGKLNSGE
jgi:hypothetical protein